MSASVKVSPAAIISSINFVVSIGLLALGIVLIVYGFRIPGESCDDDKFSSLANMSGQSSGFVPHPDKNCMRAGELKTDGTGEDLTKDVETLRVVALVTGFLLIIPFALSMTEMILEYVPGGKYAMRATRPVGDAVHGRAYRMKSSHHGY